MPRAGGSVLVLVRCPGCGAPRMQQVNSVRDKRGRVGRCNACRGVLFRGRAMSARAKAAVRAGQGRARTNPTNRTVPPASTSAAPGSEAKIAVLAKRFANNCYLFHPQDARLPRTPAEIERLIRLVAAKLEDAA